MSGIQAVSAQSTRASHSARDIARNSRQTDGHNPCTDDFVCHFGCGHFSYSGATGSGAQVSDHHDFALTFERGTEWFRSTIARNFDTSITWISPPRRELLDRIIVLNEAHLRRLMTSYLEYYHTVRPHLSLELNAPVPRPIQEPNDGKVTSMPHVGGLYQGYRRAA